MNSRPRERMILDIWTWEQTFQKLLQEVNLWDRWTLTFDETLQPDCVAVGWKQYQQKAFGRFQCSSCRRSWASAQVQILCHMFLERRQFQGQVLMRLFAQRCQKCPGAQFEKPQFSQESAMRILNNLVHRIQEKCYGNGIKKFSEIPVMPEVPLDGSHDMANCEACSLGYCGLNLQNRMTISPQPPLSYMEIGSSPHTGDVFSQNQDMNQSAEAEEAQGMWYSYEYERSGPSHTTARTPVPGTSPQPTRGADQDNLISWVCARVASLWISVTSRLF